MICPVLSSCYRQLQKYYYPPGEPASAAHTDFLKYDESLGDWDELGELIERDDAPVSSHRLRAFFALELIYFYLLPLGSHPVDKVDIRVPLQVERSRDQEGLEDLIHTCAKLKRDIIMRTGHTELLGKQRNPAFELMTASLRSMGGRIDKCAEMAKELRNALNDKRERKELEKVGRLFGDFLIASKAQIAASMSYLKTMRTISLENAVRPWNQSTQFQV